MRLRLPRKGVVREALIARSRAIARAALDMEEAMGEVKDAVTKRSSKPKKALDAGLLETAERLRDELSRCIAIKDEDTLTEGDDMQSENMRKATQLRSAHTLMSGVCAQLEDYS